MKRLCVFCGSSAGFTPAYRQATARFGRALVKRGLGLVYGGGHVGLMGVLADAVLDAGGEAIGVIPQALRDLELAHGGLTQLHVVATMHQRKALMADLADGFVALPGGYGTADELLEILTWAQLGLHARPIGLLEVNGFFQGLLTWLDHCVGEGFLRAEHRNLLLCSDDPDELLTKLQAFKLSSAPAKWIEAEDR